MLSSVPILSGIVVPHINTRYHFSGAILPHHLSFYTQYGFQHFTGFFSAGAVSELRSQIAQISAQLIASNAKTVNGIPIKYGIADNGERIIHRLPYTSHHNIAIEQLLNHAGIQTFCGLLGRSDARIGYNEKDGIVTNYYINSSNSKQRQMGWHTDSMREIMQLQRLDPMINVGLYLTDSGTHNGGLRVLPGSHTQSTPAMILSKVQLLNKRPDKNEFLVIAQAGDLVLHSGRLWHRVGKSPLVGIKSVRQVMYVPIVCGAQLHRHSNSSTPLYHKLNKYISYK